jgi:hypothetical protein
MKRWIFLLGLLASQTVTQAQEPTDELVIIDLRPREETEGNGLTELTGKCNKDVYRIADVASDPLKMDVLREEVVPLFRMTGERKTLTVLNWSIYYNTQRGQGGGPSIRSVGVQGYALPTGKTKEKQKGSKCSREESAGGWYAGGDVSSKYPPLISELTGTFSGKPFNVRVVHSPQRPITGRFEGAEDDARELLTTARETAEAVAAAIGR